MVHPDTDTAPLDLKRQLLARVTLFALAVFLAGTLFSLLEMRYRVRGDIKRTGHTIRQLVTDEIGRTHSPFDQTLHEVKLGMASLQSIGELAHFCVDMTDLYSRPGGTQCFPGGAPLPEPLQRFMAAVIGSDAQYQGTVGQYPGVTVGQITVTPDYGSELAALGLRLGYLMLVTVVILAMNLLIYRPVRRALAPSEVILATLGRMEKGDLAVRVPVLPLIEFTRIGQGFNHLADQLQQTISNQRHLAHRLLSVREEERHHLSRELHDEFGQCLASINAEAAYARELADESMPALRPCVDSISRTTHQMMESLHLILHRLRPVGLEEFGLLASLEQLVADWTQRCRGHTRFDLQLEGNLDNLSDDINVSLYRIVQESITNALRHGQARAVSIRLQIPENDNRLVLLIDNDGGNALAEEEDGNGRDGRKSGYGLLGMEERVLALGGSLKLEALPQGARLQVQLPLQPGGRP